jgi:hypothetical protein
MKEIMRVCDDVLDMEKIITETANAGDHMAELQAVSSLNSVIHF